MSAKKNTRQLELSIFKLLMSTMLILTSVTTKADPEGLRLCDLALDRCSQVERAARTHIEDLEAVIENQDQVIASGEKRVRLYKDKNQRIKEQTGYYLLGTFILGVLVGGVR